MEQAKNNSCCVTGHRDTTPERAVFAVQRMMDELIQAVSDGYTRFITGMAEGIDQLFAENVLILKKYRPEIELVAAISHRGRLKAKDEGFQRLIVKCDEVLVLSEFYNPGVYDARNRWMLANSSRLIAVWDGRLQGGAYKTIRHAEKSGIDIRRIDLK